MLDVRGGRDLHGLREYSVERTRLGLSASLLRLSGASLLADLILRHTGEEGSAAVFQAFVNALDEIEGAEEARVCSRVLGEAWGVVVALGYQPQVDACVRCGRAFAADEMGRFDFATGGVACSDCAATGPRVGPGARDELRVLTQAGPERAEELDPSHLGAHLRLLAEFTAHHVSGGRPLASFDYFLEAVHGG